MALLVASGLPVGTLGIPLLPHDEPSSASNVDIDLAAPAGSALARHRLPSQQRLWLTETVLAETDAPGRKELLCYLHQQLLAPGVPAPVSLVGGAIHNLPALHGRCAVVSSSGALRHHNFGGAIDKADAVLRFNDAPVLGFETYVGSREAVRVANDKLLGKVRAGQVQIQAGVSYVIFGADSISLQKLAAQHPAARFYMVNPSWALAVEDILKHLYPPKWWTRGLDGHSDTPTTGAIGLLLALSFCDSVEAFEMAPSSAARLSGYNYYEPHPNLRATDNSWHSSFEAEHDLWTRLSTTPKSAIQSSGKALIPGLRTAKCPATRAIAPHRSGGGAIAALLRLEAGAVQWTGVAFAFTLIAALPVAMSYTGRLWHNRYKEGLLSFQMKDMGQEQVWATASLVVYVALLISSDTLASHTAQVHGGRYPWEPVAIVLMVELTKFIVSTGLRWRPSARAATASSVPWASLAEAFMRLSPVAALYAGNNCLVYFVLARVELGAYVVWRNTTVIFNALLWTFVLQRPLRGHQWAAVAFLFAGCCLNSLDTDGSLSDVVGFPVLLLLASALASALAGALNEAILKREAFRDLGIDRLNCLLYSQTFLMLSVWLTVRTAWSGHPLLAEASHIFSNLDRSAACLVAMQASVGIAVSRVLLHADVVAKTMAGGAREIVQASVAPLFVASRLDWISFPSVLWIATAMVTYFAPKTK